MRKDSFLIKAGLVNNPTSAVRTLLPFVFLLFFILMGTGSQAQSVTVAKDILDGSKGELAKDSIAFTEDTAYFNPTLRDNLDTPYTVKNVITFKINEYARVLLPATFTASVNVRIIYSKPDLSIDSVERVMNINYSDTSVYTARSSFVFNNAHRVTVKILSVTTNATSNVVPALVLENEMDIRLVYKLSCVNGGVQSIGIVSPTPANTDSTDEIGVTWPAMTGADVYDLEWAYIDSTALLSGRYGEPLNRNLIFRNNATRVTVATNTYNIPLLYSNGGVLFFRVRAVQEKTGVGRTETPWSSLYQDGLGQYAFTGHQHQLNWQSKVEFAENGMRKAVVRYYDGSLRNRQTVTKDNTTNTTVVAETYYDRQGRSAIEVLPAPTLSSVIKYSRNFNRTINGGEYDKGNYDTLVNAADILTAAASPMSNTSGANQYYSANNPEKDNGVNKYIPDAGGYAFTETSYTQDNTDRISRKSGVGPTYRLGSNHETKFSYGAPGDNDLDALFGTEIGVKSHYFKNIVQDANGQYHVSYIDMYGRTVATALSGVPDSANLAGLSYNPLISYTDTLSKANNRIVKDLVMENTQSQLVTLPGNYVFNYKLQAPVLQRSDCNNNTVCYNGLFDLEISITDDASNQRLGGKPFDTVLHNYTPGSIPASCGVPDMTVGFTIFLPAGTYQITKRLSVNREAMDYYRDSVYMKKQMCTTLEQFVQQQRDILAKDSAKGCVPDCKACRDSIGAWDAFRNNYLAKAGVSPVDSASYRGAVYAAYLAAVAACDVLCDAGSEIAGIRNAMLLDVTGPYGQYANPADTLNVYSIFYHADENITAPYRRDTVVYYDELGRRDTVYDEISDTYVIPQLLHPQQFAAKFKESWAEALLKFHPEYYKLLEMQKYADSYLWDKTFEGIDTYAEAKAAGYLNPTANNSFIFPVVTGNIDPLAATAKDGLEKMLNNFNGGSGASLLSMWSMATVSVKCSRNGANCYQQYNTPAKAFNEALMCKGDLDMAWRAFRQMYLTTKHNIINDRINNVIYPGYPRVTSAQLSAAGNQPDFYVVTDALKENGGGFMGNNADSTILKDSANAQLQRSYDENCRSYVQAWVKQLAPCKYSQQVLDSILIPKLLAVCKEGADMDHPYGASSVKPSSGSYYRSFSDVLNAYNAQAGITDPLSCNAYLITLPAPYDKQAAYTNRPTYTAPGDCECNQLRLLNTEYLAYKKPSDISLATYLNRTRGTSLSDVEVQQLLSACNVPGTNTCTYFEQPLVIPTIMQCNIAAPCASCEVVGNSYSRFQASYPGVTPLREEADSVQQRKNELFVNFMNNQLGMSKQLWEYMAFMDTCQLYPFKDSIVCRGGKQLIHSYATGSIDTVYDVIRTPDNGFMIAGSTTIAANNKNAYLIRTDSKGEVLWSKHYGGAGNDDFMRIRSTTDGGYIAVGTIAAYAVARDAMIVKLTAQGDVTWSKRVGLNTTWGEVGTDIVQTSDGGYAYVARYNLADGVADFLVGSLQADGAFNWLKRFGQGSGDEGYSLLENKDTLVIAGCSWVTGVTGQFDGWILKVDKKTGKQLHVHWYDIGQPTKTITNFSNFIHKVKGGYITSYSAGDAGGVRQAILSVADNGQIKYVKQFSRPLDKTVIRWMPTAVGSDGNIMAVQNVQLANNYGIVWEKTSGDGNLLWSDLFKSDSAVFFAKLVENADGGFVGAGNYSRSAMMIFTPPNGPMGCSDSLINDTFDPVGVRFNPDTVMVWDVVIKDTAVKAFTLTGNAIAPVHKVFNCIGADSCFRMSKGPLLCGNTKPVFGDVDVNEINNCSDNEFFAVSKGTELFNAYRDSLKAGFNKVYIDSCMNAGLREIFTVSYTTSEYHYTLYYYDRAGSLVKTVPPAGVVVNRTPTWLNAVKAARAKGLEQLPAHTMVTNYRYNTLNQVIAKMTPDITAALRYAYDRVGRLVAAQPVISSSWVYTVYDNLGRITQTGATTTQLVNTTSRNPYSLAQWYANMLRTEVIATTYDEPYTPLSGVVISQRNLRGRVSWSGVFSGTAAVNSGAYTFGTFYSYDAHGNVDTLVQDFKTGGMADGNNRWKKMVYQYDLISGKVKHMAYQPGARDALYHRFTYNANNKMTNVETSRDSINWDKDAYYQYYKYGPLARAVIGQQQVQGIDYAYTLQGWVKGINSTADTSIFDMGGDGASTSSVAKDVYGLALHYYGARDYKPIGSTARPFADPGTVGGNFKPLFNGNIAGISQNISSVGSPLMYNYTYDVLNRIAGMQAVKGLDKTNNTWTPVVLPDFKEDISYDPNGNIRTYLRKGNNTFAGQPLAMDSLTYNYTSGTNKLLYIFDGVAAGNYPNDIDNQATNNYNYTGGGQLNLDRAAGITSIQWTGYDKIRLISSASGSTNYTYDVSNKRVSKTFKGIQTWYVRDASGNVMSVYVKGDSSLNGGLLTQTEAHLYGDDRLGINDLSTDVQSAPLENSIDLPGLGSATEVAFVRGKKLFELSNHLGNVLATVSDRRRGVSTDGSTIDHYEANLVSAQDYYPFGMQMPGRGFASGNYRYGFNGKENDNDVKGDGNQQDYGMRIYDNRVGRFLSMDPLAPKYPELTPYQFASNKPINSIDLDGLESWELTTPLFKLNAALEISNNKTAIFIQQQRAIEQERINVMFEQSAKTPKISKTDDCIRCQEIIDAHYEGLRLEEKNSNLDPIVQGGAGFGRGLVRDPFFQVSAGYVLGSGLGFLMPRLDPKLTWATFGIKFSVDVAGQTLSNGGNIWKTDFFDAGLAGLTMPMTAHALGSLVDVKPFDKDKIGLTFYNKSLLSTGIDFGVKVVFGGSKYGLGGWSKAKLNNSLGFKSSYLTNAISDGLQETYRQMANFPVSATGKLARKAVKRKSGY
ncbi:RHS repeat domain-containing protein [Chitinophaga ginsengisoli]|uniref:RHS repeat-associated protein n=1 Tax=Chitinophaga ginsengisoli TaxID=363837 RepID=A0A2P8FS28_9BACT|nr:RHS repeat-associated core domain-containing protein [Chitinophaga ginsengisoli]PSL24497.1 RHS repeat-associated protein [Chitinophaga ginsengisoli]